MSIPVPVLCCSGVARLGLGPRCRAGDVLGAVCKQLVSPPEPLPRVASGLGGCRALEPVSQLFANVDSLSLCPSMHPSVHPRCVGRGWSLRRSESRGVRTVWMERAGVGRALSGGRWVYLGHLCETGALTSGPGTDLVSGLPGGKGCDCRRLSPGGLGSPGLPSVSTHLALVSESLNPPPLQVVGGGRGERGLHPYCTCLWPPVPGAGGSWHLPGGDSGAASRPWPSVTPFPVNSVPRQTVPDFQETRPRNYILSASASAVSAPPHPASHPQTEVPRGPGRAAAPPRSARLSPGPVPTKGEGESGPLHGPARGT